MKRKHQGSTFHVLASWSAEMSAPVLTRRALRTELFINHCLQQPFQARFGGEGGVETWSPIYRALPRLVRGAAGVPGHWGPWGAGALAANI